MRLVDLHPRFFGNGGAGVTDREGQPVPERLGVGLGFDCPCGKCDNEFTWVYVAFTNPLDGGPPVHDEGEPTWQRTGETFDTLTLAPSILRRTDCGWHGFIRDGGIVTV